MNKNHKTNRLLICVHLFVVLFFGLLTNTYAQSAIAPKTLGIYYGWPSLVNKAKKKIKAAVKTFKAYDVVVLGDSLEFPQFTKAKRQFPNPGCKQNSHKDHDFTKKLIKLLKPKTKVYGYVAIGGENTNRKCSGVPTPLTIPQMKAQIKAWKAMGVAGIFLDEAEYGFGTTRTVQNTAVDFVRRKKLKVFINGFHPDDVFGATIVNQVQYSNGNFSTVPMNPTGEPSHLRAGDIYLLENFQINNGDFVDVQTWTSRASKAYDYKQIFGVEVATITTQLDVPPPYTDCNLLFDKNKFDYAWWSTLLYGFDYMGWGEPSGFSSGGSCSGYLPYHARPVLGNMGEFVSPVLNDAIKGTQIYYRDTTAGVIAVDTNSHTGGFIPN